MSSRADFFDRTGERRALEDFVSSSVPHASLALVSGRRKMGKTALTRHIADARAGFHHTAAPVPYDASLSRLRTDLAAFLHATSPEFTTWPAALDALLRLGHDRELTVVLDDFAELMTVDARLPGMIAAAFDPDRPEARASRTRLILSGSAATHDGYPSLRHKSLREAAAVDVRLTGLDYREAADWWGVDDPQVAMPLYAMLGGTPVYRDQAADVPKDPGDIGPFAARTVLNAEHVLFNTAWRLMQQEVGPNDIGRFRTIPFTIAFGTSSLERIARHFLVEPIALRRQLTTLVACGFLERRTNVFDPADQLYRITEPLLTFYHAMMRTDLGRYRRGYIHEYLWKYRAHRFSTMVLNPQFAQIAREWAGRYAPDGFFGGDVAHVGWGTVDDPLEGEPHRVDLAVLGEPDGERVPLLAMGVSAWDREVGDADLSRLRRIGDLVTASERYDTSATRLYLFGGGGFSDGLRAAADRGEVTLVDPAVLYGI